MLIDKEIGMTGSMNWSSNSIQCCEETVVWLTSDYAMKQLDSSFSHYWAKAVNVSLPRLLEWCAKDVAQKGSTRS